jgi:hypothetical protein
MQTTLSINLATNEVYFNKLHFIADSVRSVTFGDLHGNTHKLLANLYATKVINKADLVALSGIYEKLACAKETTLSQLEIAYRDFDKRLQQATFNKVNFKLRFIGDTLADRGAFDLLTLLVFQAMDSAGIDFSIIYSNHDLIFLETIELLSQGKWLPPTMPVKFIHSFYILCVFLFQQHATTSVDDKGEYFTFTSEQLRKINRKKLNLLKTLYECYIKHLHLCESETILGLPHIFTHAPTSELYLHELYQELLQKKLTKLNDENITQLDAKFTDICHDGKLHTHLDRENYQGPLQLEEESSCLHFFCYTRKEKKEAGSLWINIFGHIGDEPHPTPGNKSCINLDGSGNIIGKNFLNIAQRMGGKGKELIESSEVPVFITHLV